jgi:hypothetical protein
MNMAPVTPKDGPITLPDWLPGACVGMVLTLERCVASEEDWAILRRLVTHQQMQVVWRELTKRNQTSGRFSHPPKPLADKPSLTPDDAQDQALSELFNFAYSAARDKIATSTLADAQDRRRRLVGQAQILREGAEMQRQIGGPQAAADADAVDRAAERLEAAARDVRSIGDPLSVQRQRGDPTVNGVAAIIGVWLFERFGKRFDETAATLASVALGKPATARTVRSALARIK